MKDTEQYKQNNLAGASSPYLVQHARNPIWWQEWSSDVIDFAVATNKPLLVSVGYSTCHWCHVMAAEAFSDNETAKYLNENFVCIKVDREQRPDIDQYLMNFMNSQSESGGWPLNVFLTPSLKPVVAVTYLPPVADHHRISFLELAKRVSEYFTTKGDDIPSFTAGENEAPPSVPEKITEELISWFDNIYGGFGSGQKFPPHTTLLFLLYKLSAEDNEDLRGICSGTLNAMQLGGLNDHLQGGIFRYCVDRSWTIPHFEKMLYDQALALWTWSLAFRVLGNPDYKIMAEKVLLCLEECFRKEDLFITAFNADTGHQEGATYLWDYDEIEKILGPEDLNRFREVYIVSREGNFEGKNHLLRKNTDPLPGLEKKLLAARDERQQPSADEKILCGLNALTAIAYIQAGRLLDRPPLEAEGERVIRKLLGIFWDGKSLSHSYFKGALQKQSFLSDAGAVLTAITMLYENDPSWEEMMKIMAEYTESFRRDGRWLESDAGDFMPVYASWFDHPAPSAVSLTETGLIRHAILTGKEYLSADFRKSFQSDFYNLSVLIRNGYFHVITTREAIPWNNLPINALRKTGEPETDCYMGTCRFIEPQ
ncbi:MAG: thioredoxin domain-containing protein [Bacteroidales bacterium]|nr:thioredoxin domain-containing protein [Bacteroidales bacterium]